MKFNVGDLVKRRSQNGQFQAGLITDFVDKKCWRTSDHGKKVDWDKIKPEPHAVVLIGERYMTIPVADLQLIDTSFT